jgi:hypothetical protein
MARAEAIVVNVNDALKDCDLRITFRIGGLRRLAFRLWIGGQLIQLASWIMGVPIDVEMAGD